LPPVISEIVIWHGQHSLSLGLRELDVIYVDNVALWGPAILHVSELSF
jgi:hypothetical protein